MEDIQIFKSIKTVNGYPAILVESIDATVIADLHLGYELALAEQGIFIPQTQLKEIMKTLGKILRKTKTRNLIIVGDVKHEFGEASNQEWREVKKLVEFLRKKVERIILIRGNHDNYLLTICSHIGIELYDPYYLEKGICFLHGHKKVEVPSKIIETMIIAHEHPSLVLREGFDRVKVPCLLYGKMKDGKNFICLPAISPLAEGTEVNLSTRSDLLSPILREDVKFEDLVPITLEEEVGALKFPKLKDLKL
jgi:hypothetical protein